MKNDTPTKEQTFELTITIVKDCGTCKLFAYNDGFIEDEPSGKCTLTNETVTISTDSGVAFKQVECGHWSIDKTLFDESHHFIKKINDEEL